MEVNFRNSQEPLKTRVYGPSRGHPSENEVGPKVKKENFLSFNQFSDSEEQMPKRLP